MNDFGKIKKAAKLARDILPNHPGLDEALDPVKYQEMVETAPQEIIESATSKAEVISSLKLDWKRMSRCRTAGEVMTEFAEDAAKLKVSEMFMADESGDRQRAQETVINYALGRPIERRMSMEMKVSGASDKELEGEITRLLDKFGFQGGKRTSASILIDDGAGQGPEQTKELQTMAGVSTDVSTESTED